MTKKIIKYEVELLSTRPKRYFEKERVYTNDLNSVEFQFEITDIPDLTDASASVQLYMRDGSFFERSKDEQGNVEVTLSGNTFSYVLKENEGNHAGLMQIQLMVTIGDVVYATQNYDNVVIVPGLETKVAVEVMVQDWTRLTRQARQYIDEFKANELIRQEQFDSAQVSRTQSWNVFKSAADTNESQRVANETTRNDSEETRVLNEETRVDNEQQRVEAEGVREAGYEVMDGRIRQGELMAENLVPRNEAFGNAFGGSLSVREDYIELTSVNDIVYSRAYATIPEVKVGDKYYVRASFYTTDKSNIRHVAISQPSHNYMYGILGYSNAEIQDGVWMDKSHIYIATSNAGQFTIRFESLNVNEPASVRYKKMMLVNLTRTFGAGNEPTKEQMDRIMAFFPDSWFDGTKNIAPALQIMRRLLALDIEKANRKQEDWITPNLLNGWGESASGGVRYYKDEFGRVNFKGIMTLGSVGSIAFLLPVGYRPGEDMYVETFSSATEKATIRIRSNGQVYVSTPTSWGSMHNISFRAEN